MLCHAVKFEQFNMLSCSNILPTVFAFVTIGGCFLSSTDALYNNSIRPERLPPFVRFSNPDMMSSDVGDGSSFPFDTTQEDADPLKLGGIRLREEAKKLSVRLRRLSNEEMGITTMQTIFDSLGYAVSSPDYEVKLSELSKQLGIKLSQYLGVLRTSKMTVENLYQQHLLVSTGQPLDCCEIPNSALKWDENYASLVSHEFSCDLLPPTAASPGVFNPGRNLTEVFQHNVQYIQSIKWQYFISTEGIYNEFPAHNCHCPSSLLSSCKNAYDSRHRNLFYSSVYQRRKNVVVVIDQGNSLSPVQLKIAKAVAKNIINSLNENDQVAVMSVSSDVKFSRNDRCVLDQLMHLTYETKLFHHVFIDHIVKEATPMNHSLAFKTAFNLIRKSKLSGVTGKPADVLIAYISRGLLSTIADAKGIISALYDEIVRTSDRVFINTYAVIDETKPVMYERSFLQDIAEQNFSKFLTDQHLSIPPLRGKAVAVNSTHNLCAVLGDIFEPFGWTVDNLPILSLPVKDELSKGMVVSLTWPCLHDGHLFGVVGMDIHAGDVLESATYYTEDNSYVVLLNNRGKVLVHPDLDRPILSSIQPLFTDLIHFENIADAADLQKRMTQETKGQETVFLQVPVNSTRGGVSSNMRVDSLGPGSADYYWQHITMKHSNQTAFIVVLKVFHGSRRYLKPNSAMNDTQLVYHRLDLLSTDHSCIHLKQLATFDVSTFFLTASAFVHPFDHLIQDETKRMVQGYLAYLNDNTNLISNPGILDHIRMDVMATSVINSEWLRQSIRSSLSEHIVRRYVATPNGVFRVFPGTLLNKKYDPTRRQWYIRALERPGKVTLTPPYLDSGGAGYIVTISHTIYEGKPAALHGPSDRVTAVMGLDVPFKYVYRLLTEQLPVCELENIRCFIMDDRGYLVAHRGLIEANDRGPLEEKHITHKEPLVSNDILNHRGFVTKRACHSFMDRTTQRFYQFNTSLDGILTNLVHGEHCARYQITPIFGTNSFIGIVNQTCDMIRAFCPCSMVDRLCLNCHRMEQTECECPCECPLSMNFCSDDIIQANESKGSCSRYPEEIDTVRALPELGRTLPQCYQPNCGQKLKKNDCIGVIDCEWCEVDNDRVTRVKQPFCASQRMCFGGVLGAQSPYNDHIPYRELPKEDPVTFKSMPVGPVAGGIMGGFLLLALGIYCHRHRICQDSRYSGSLPDGQLRDPNNENDFDEMDDSYNGYINIVLSTFDNPAKINPYFMNTSYRRPTNTESDLGYSSMTPRDDSEQASTACMESVVMGRDRYRPAVPVVRPPTSGAPLTILPPPPPVHGARKQKPLVEVETSANASVPERGDFGAEPMQTVIPDRMTLLPHQVVTDVVIHATNVH